MSILDGASPLTGFPALDSLAWVDDPAQARTAAREKLRAEALLGKSLVAWLDAMNDRERGYVGLRSLDKETHQKWFLGENESRYVVWLHQYASPEVFSHSSRFAASVHNHRYGFASRVLSGGLDVREFRVEESDDRANLREIARRSLSAGETMCLSPDDVHMIDGVSPNTCTLVIQGPAMRRYSVRYNSDGTSQQIYDHEGRLDDLIGGLASTVA